MPTSFRQFQTLSLVAMRRLFFLLILAGLAFGIWQFLALKSARDHLAIAEQRVLDVAATGTNTLDFSDLPELRRLPRNIGEVENLVYLTVRNTKLNDLSGVENATTLEHLDLNMTRVADLRPLAGLEELRLIYLHDTWVRDLEPLATLPSLSHLDIGKTQVNSLEPVTRIENLAWLNLHKGHALDGSIDHFAVLDERVFFELEGGAAYRQNYQPGFVYNATLRLGRLKDILGA